MFFCGLEMGTLSTHSGYNLPFNYKCVVVLNSHASRLTLFGNSALQHDWHHYFYQENYGPTGALDALHGTNVVFRAWISELSRRDLEKKRDGEGNGSSRTENNNEDVYTRARREIAEKEVIAKRS